MNLIGNRGINDSEYLRIHEKLQKTEKAKNNFKNYSFRYLKGGGL